MAERQEDLRTIQALRGVAAFMVVGFHVANVWGKQLASPRVTTDVWPNGSAGVDVFFVISGLVMTISAQRLAGRNNAWRVFVRRRLIRIVPLYWIMTSAKVVLTLALPTLVQRTHLEPGYVAESYLFLPVRDAVGGSFPVLPVGWTLTFEMLFYALVAAALFSRASLFCTVLPVLAVLAVTSLFQTAAWPAVGDYANPIVLEFLFGAAIGACFLRGFVLPAAWASCVLPLAFVAIATVAVGSASLRPLTWGIPAAVIVASAVALEPRIGPFMPRSLLTLGDTSYSVYLTHGFVLPAVFMLLGRFKLSGALGLVACVGLSFVASGIVGWISFVSLERPILQQVRRRHGAPAIAGAR